MAEPRTAPLTVSKGGIDRLRPKGGARADSLFDLVNAKIDKEFNIIPREGTARLVQLPEGTQGLTSFDDRYHVFSAHDVDMSSVEDEGFVLDILLHPTSTSAEIVRIPFAQPFLGALYVVAEFDDGSAYHYWLQPGETWQSETDYSVNEFVTPQIPNGYVYSASRFTQPYPAWTPGTPRTAGNGSSDPPSRIEPTVYNEFFYETIATEGDNPRSGSVEPQWPTEDGATIVENTDGFAATTPDDGNPPAPPAANTPQASTTERYDR